MIRPAGARGTNGTAGALAAAHAQDNAFGLNDLVALAAADAVYLLIGGHFQHHGAQFHPHAGCAQHLDIAPGVFRAGKLLAKPMQAKPVVDALVQNTAQLLSLIHI